MRYTRRLSCTWLTLDGGAQIPSFLALQDVCTSCGLYVEFCVCCFGVPTLNSKLGPQKCALSSEVLYQKNARVELQNGLQIIAHHFIGCMPYHEGSWACCFPCVPILPPIYMYISYKCLHVACFYWHCGVLAGVRNDGSVGLPITSEWLCKHCWQMSSLLSLNNWV